LRRIGDDSQTVADAQRESILAVARDDDLEGTLPVGIAPIVKPLLSPVLGDVQIDAANAGRTDVVDLIADAERPGVDAADRSGGRR
jgi:hypothetical protein